MNRAFKGGVRATPHEVQCLAMLEEQRLNVVMIVLGRIVGGQGEPLCPKLRMASCMPKLHLIVPHECSVFFPSAEAQCQFLFLFT